MSITSIFLSDLILRCSPTDLAFGKSEDRLREPRRMLKQKTALPAASFEAGLWPAPQDEVARKGRD